MAKQNVLFIKEVRFCRKPIQQWSGGVSYQSMCGHWRVFHESPKSRRGHRIRRWWYISYREDARFGRGFQHVPGHERARYKTRRQAEEAVQKFAGELNHRDAEGTEA